MKFLRATKYVREITPRRIANAKRHVRKELDSVALFPDLARVRTAEEKIANDQRESAEWQAATRKRDADDWREARRRLRARPDYAIVFAHWQRGIYPATPVYLLNLMHNVDHNGFDIPKYHRELEAIKKLGPLTLNAPRYDPSL